jgi:hypothetical protein
MSVTVVLLPVLIASALSATGGIAGVAGAAHAILKEGTSGKATIAVRTRMKDRTLLGRSLLAQGATDLESNSRGLSATIQGLSIEMTVDKEGIWQAHLTSLDGTEPSPKVVSSLISAIDANYALQVQEAVAERIRERAADSGLDLVSETYDDEDASITMLLTVRDEA